MKNSLPQSVLDSILSDRRRQKVFTGHRTERGFLIVLPLPPKALSPNARCHWAKKASAAKQYRRDAGMVALSVLNAANESAPKWERATAKITGYFATAARRDEDNFQASLKAGLDGLADAGLVLNDSGLSPWVVLMAVDRERPRVEIVIEPIS